MILFFALLFLIVPAFIVLISYGIIKGTLSKAVTYTGQNLRIVLFSWLTSSVLLAIYLKIYASSDIYFELLMGIFIMGYFVFFSFIGLWFFNLPREFYKWSDTIDFCIKIVFTLIAYIPVRNFLRDMQYIYPFAHWSLAGTIAVIVFNYRHLLIKHFTPTDPGKEDFNNSKTDAI